MVGEEDFGPLLKRLLDRRGLDPTTTLSRQTSSRQTSSREMSSRETSSRQDACQPAASQPAASQPAVSQPTSYQPAPVPESQLRAVLAGAAPSPPLLRRLAPVLGLHTADLFAIAGAGIPEDLAPLDDTAGRHVPRLARDAAALPPDQRNALRRLVASLPQEERTQPPPKHRGTSSTLRAPAHSSCA